MDASRTKPFGPARIVALALISLTALGLAYLHFSAGNDSVSVPSGAHADQRRSTPATTRPRAAATAPIAARSSYPKAGTRRTRG